VPNTTNIIPENTFPTISENSFVANAENESNNNAIPTNATISNENMNTINMDENDRSLYIASFEIDGEKLRGVTRRINAYLRRNKNEKQK
jgi:hypothetical protein